MKIPVSALALLAASLTMGCRSSVGSWEEALSRADAPSSSSPAPAARWAEAAPREEAKAWPAAKGILLALTRWDSTDLIALDPATGASVPLAKKIPGDPEFSLVESHLAIRISSGVNPARNVLEILDLRRGENFVLDPADGYAFIGFTLAPSGTTVAYTEIDLRRSNSRRVLWRISLAERGRQSERPLATSDSTSIPAGVVPVPFAWSKATGEIVLEGLLPFRGMSSGGIWAMRADGSEIRPLLSESSYTASPRLSFDGRYLAHLATRMEDLPRGYLRSPGAPPANLLVMTDLTRGETLSRTETPEVVFGTFAWSGDEVLASERQWKEGQLREVTFAGAAVNGSLTLRREDVVPASRVTQLGRCRSGPFHWVEEDRQGARLRSSDAKRSELMTFPAGKIRIVGCLEAGER